MTSIPSDRMPMSFEELPEFEKEFKKLSKKYRSLSDDLEEFKHVLRVRPLGAGKHFNVLVRTEAVVVVKARLFCQYLRGSSLRIIYAYHETGEACRFIEIYFKGDRENENRVRIDEYMRMQK